MRPTSNQVLTRNRVLLILLSLLLAGQYILLPPASAQEQAMNIDEVIKNTDPTKFTKAQINEYFKQVKGKAARGEGKVVDVLPPRVGSRGMLRVTILTAASKPEKGYNVVLLTTQSEAVSELKMNDHISFEGKIDKISTFRGTSVDLIGTYRKK